MSYRHPLAGARILTNQNDQPEPHDNDERVKVFPRVNPDSDGGFTISFPCPDCKHDINFRMGGLSLESQLVCPGCGVEVLIDRKSLNRLEKRLYDTLDKIFFLEISLIDDSR